MRTEFEKPDKASGEDILDALLKRAKDTKKEFSGKATLTLKVNGIDKAISDFDKLSNAYEDFEKLRSTPGKGNVNGLAKYYGTEEKMIQNLRSAWNNYVKDVENGDVNPNNLGGSSSAKAVLRYYNALNAAYGDDAISKVSDNLNIIKEIEDHISSMKSLDNFADGAYNMDIGHFQEVFSILQKIVDESKSVGVDNINTIFDALGFGGYDKLDKVVEQVQSVGDALKKARGETSGLDDDYFDSFEEETESHINEMEKQAEREEKVYKTIEQIREKARKNHEKYDFQSDADYNREVGWDEEISEDNKIQSLKDILKQLIQKRDEKQSEIDDDIRYYNDYVNSQNDEHVSRYERYLSDEYEELLNFEEKIEYINGRLSEEVLDFKPGDSWGADEISALIALLQQLADNIKEISNAIGQMDNETGIPIITQQFNDMATELSKVIMELLDIKQVIGGIDFNVMLNIGGGKSITGRAQQESMAAIELINRYKQAYDSLLDTLTQNGTGTLSIFKGQPGLLSRFMDATDLIGSDSKTGQISGYKQAVDILKQAASLNGINLSEWTDSFENAAIEANESFNKIVSGQKEVEDNANVLKNLFGAENKVELPISADQINDLVELLQQLQNILKHGLGLDELENENSFKSIIDTARLTAEMAKSAADAILEEGRAAVDAASLKERFAEANRQVAESARQTSEDTKKAADGIKTEGEAAEYDDDEMKRRAGLIDEEAKKKATEAKDNGELASIQYMYDSHHNLVEAIVTTRKKIEADEREAAKYQTTSTNIHWDKKGNYLYSSKKDTDDYKKARDEQNKKTEKEQKEENDRLVKQAYQDAAERLKQEEEYQRERIRLKREGEKQAQEIYAKERTRLEEENAHRRKQQQEENDIIENNNKIYAEYQKGMEQSDTTSEQKYNKTYEQNLKAIKDMAKDAQTAQESMREVFKMFREGDIGQEQFDSALSLFRTGKSNIRGNTILNTLEQIKQAAKEYYEARNAVNELEAKRIGTEGTSEDVANTLEWAEANKRLEDSFIQAATARKTLEAIKDDISEDEYNDTLEKLSSGDLGSAKSRDKIIRNQQQHEIASQIDSIKQAAKDYYEARTELNQMISDHLASGGTMDNIIDVSGYDAASTRLYNAIDAMLEAKDRLSKLKDQLKPDIYDSLLKKIYSGNIGSPTSVKNMDKAKKQIADTSKKQQKDIESDMSQYAKAEKEYLAIRSKQFSSDANKQLTVADTNKMTNALNTMVSIEQRWNDVKTENLALSKEQEAIAKRISENSKNDTKNGNIEEESVKNRLESYAQYDQAIKQYNSMLTKLNSMEDQTAWRAPGWADEIDKLKSELEGLNLDTILTDNTGDAFGEIIQGIKRIRQEAQDASKDIDFRPVREEYIASLDAKIANWMDTNKRAAKEFGDELENLREQLRGIQSEGEGVEIENSFNFIDAQAADMGLKGKSLGDRFRDQFSNTMTSLATYYLSFQDFIRYGRQAISVVRELDTALTEVRKVSSESLGSLRDWQVSTFDQANTVGGSAKQLQESTASWLRLGKSFEESQEAAQASVKLLNVSEFTNIDDATTSLVSMRQAFQDLTYDDFIDKLNGVGDNFSSSTDQLAYGMQNVSSVLKVAGNDIDQSLALLTAANDVTQDMSKASMGVRTIALRMSGTEEAKQELEEMGEDTSDFIVQTQSKVDEQVRKYTATAANPEGISVLDDNGRLRSTYDVLLDISKVYDEIVEKDNEYGTNTSNALLELLAGKTRSNILASILQNPDLLEASYKQSQNSQGIGQRELDIYLDSVEAHIARLQNRLQELAYVTINSDDLKVLIDLLTLAVQGATALSKTLGGINLIIGAAFTAFTKIKKNGPSFLDYDSRKGFSGTLIDIFGSQKQPSASSGSASPKPRIIPQDIDPVSEALAEQISETFPDTPVEAPITVTPKFTNPDEDFSEQIEDELEKVWGTSPAKTKIDIEPEAKVDEQAAKQAAQDASDKVQEQAEKTATPVMTPGKVDAKEATEEAKQAMEEAKEQVESEPTTMSPEITVDGAKVNAEPLKQQVQEKVNEAKAEAEENVDFSDTPDGTGARRGGIGYKIGGAKEYVEQKIGKGKGGRKSKKDQAREERSAKKQARDEANQAKFKKQEESTEATAQNIDQASEAEQQLAENAEKAQKATQQVNDAAEQTTPAVQQAANGTKEMANGFEQAKSKADGTADATKNVGSAASDATENVGKMGQIFDKLKGGLKNIGGQFLSIATNMAIATAASMAITGIMKAIKYIAEYDENIIQKGREAQATIADINKAYDETESKTKDLGKRYNELRAGVAYTPDGNGISNIKLSEEEYAEFLDINNQLASLYPELVSGQDAQGNSLVDLGTNAQSATDKLNEYLNIQREIANYDIAANMQDAVNGVVKQNERVETELGNMREQAERYEASIGQYQFAEPETKPWWLDSETKMETVEIDWFDKDTRTKLHNAIEQVQTETGAQISEMGFDDEFFKTDEFGNQVRKYQVAVQGTEEEVKSATEQLSEFFSTAIRGLEDEHEQATNKMKISEKQIADNWAALAPSLASSIKTGKTYKDLVGVSPEIEEAFSRMLNNVDYGNIFEHANAAQKANFVPYLRDMLVYSFDAAIDGASDKDQMQKNIEDLLTFDSSKMDTQTLKDNLNSLLDDIFGDDEELKQNIRIALGFTFVDDDGEKWKADELDSKIKDIVSTRKGGKVFARYASVALNQEDKATLEKMEKNGAFDIDLTKAKNGAEALDMIIEKIKEYRNQEQEIEKTGSLGDIFANETYQTNVGKYQERLSSLTSAMSALRDEGNLTAETMKELQEQFPDMTDFSEAGMQKYATEQLNSWINEFKEGWTDFSPEGIEQLDTYLQNLITTYKDVKVNANDAKQAVIDSLMGSLNIQGLEKGDVAQSYYQQGIDRLTETYGTDLNWNIILALKDQFSGDLDELVDRYGNYEAHWTIMVTNAEEIENLANKLTDLQTQQSEIEDGISYRENRGLKKTVKQYDDLLDNSKEQVKTIREQNKLTREQQKQLVKINGEAYKTTNAYRNMQSQIDSNNATLRSLAESQREYQMQAGTIATQNIIDTISSLKQTLSEGGLGSETLYNLIKDMPNASDALFHTSSGQFVDTQKMNELVQEQGDFAIAIAETQQAAEALKLQKNEKDMEEMSRVTGIATNDVEALQAALKEDPGDFYLNKYMDLQESNQNIRDTILNLETLQQELRQAQSDFGQYQLAQSSWNPSDNMQTIRSGMEGAMELFKDGWLGKDDFTTFAKLLATDEEIANGTFIDNFEANYQKRQRYLTENAEGVHRWYDDIIAKNEELSENWVDIDGNIHIDNMKEFAKQMGVSQEFAETMLMAMRDAAYDVDLSIIGDEFANNFKDIDFTANNARGQVKNLITEMNNLSDAGVDVSGGAEAAADAIQQLALKGHDVSGLVDQLNTIGLDNGFHIDPTTFEVTTVVNNEELEKTKSEAEQGANMPIKARLQQGAKNALETLGANIKTEIEARQIEKQTAPITDGLGNVESAVGDLGGNIDAAASSIVGAITGQNPDGTTNGTKNSPTTGGFNTVLPEPSKSPQIPSFNQVAQGVTQGMMPSMDSDTIQKTVQYTAEDSEIQSKDKEIESQNLEQQVDITYNEKNPFRATTEEKVVKVKTESDGKNTTPGDTTSTHHFEGDESGLKKEAEEAKKDVDNVPGKKNVVFQGIDQASSVANRVKNAISGVTGKAVEIVAKTTGLDRLQSVKNLIDNIRSKTVNVVTNVVKRISGAIKNGIGEAIGTAHVSYAIGTAYASGTAYDMWEDYRHSKNAWAKGTPQDWELPQDEEALVNEVGTESIVRDGRWFEIPGNAHVEQLKRGDILFSAKQTEELKKYGKVYSGGGHGKIAYANGTAYNMINARVRANTKANVSPNKYVRMSRQNVGMSSSSTTKSNTSAVKSNTSATKTATKSTNKNTGSLDAFKQWLEKFVDWIEVRINRVSESIDNLSQISENLVGYAKKNAEVNKAMSLTGLGTEQYSLRTSKDGDGVQRVSGITYSGSQKGTQIDNNLRGAERYFKHAEAIREQAIKNGLVNATQAADIVGKIQSGAIDIKSYEEKQREFISSYQEW